MKKRKLLLGLAIASTSLLALAACGSKNESSSAAASSAAASSEVASSAVASSAATSSAATSSAAASSAAASSVATSSEVASSSTTAQETTDITMNGVKYDTIKEALAAIPTSGDTSTYTIKLPKGTYEENGLAYNGTATVKISGDTTAQYGADVIIKGHGSDMTTEKTRSLIAIQGSGNIILENLTLLSDWTRAGAAEQGIGGYTQAEVLGTDTTGNTVAYNCSFLSHQDTLRTAGKAWFYGCYVEGDVDFLWMEAKGTVALYEKCEIVAVGDETTKSYLCAPRMAISSKAGKGLVIYNSTVKEKEDNAATLDTYLARSPWTTGYYSQVAYINTDCSGINSKVWYTSSIANEYDETCIGFKMDQATATSLGYAGNGDIISETDKANEFSGRRAILNRIYNAGKLKYEKDSTNLWDIDTFITEQGWTVDTDNSSVLLEGEVEGETTTYTFDGNTDYSSICNGFAVQSGKAHYVGSNNATISIPVSGKCYVEVYGYYSGTAEIKADTQNEAVMFFNNNSTGSEVLNTYTVYDGNATEVVLTAKATTYITKIVVTTDDTITETKVEGITISASTTTECVGVGLTLSSSITNGSATNKSVKWSSSEPTVGTIDEYTGVVKFLTAGTVTFTATACDGSGVTSTITCNPIEPKWTECEFYTLDNDLTTDDGADGYSNWNTNSSAYKALGSTFTFTNMAGDTKSTTCGLKLNSTGSLSIALTKSPATLTVVIAHINKAKATPVVTCGSTSATLLSSTDSTDGLTTTYVYKLTSMGTWTITRGDNSTENDPILYAHCAYATEIDSNTFVTYKGSTYSATGTDATTLNHNSGNSSVSSTDAVTYDLVTYTGCKSNGTDNWLKFNEGATISFKVAAACTVKVYYYNGQPNSTVTLDGTTVATTTSTDGASYTTAFEYAITEAGTVTITSTSSSNSYLGAIEIVF